MTKFGIDSCGPHCLKCLYVRDMQSRKTPGQRSAVICGIRRMDRISLHNYKIRKINQHHFFCYKNNYKELKVIIS